MCWLPQESFGHGSSFAVKELTVVRGEKRIIEFHAAVRLDGLARREELFGVKLTEHFIGRDDFLTYRSATFGAAPPTSGSAADTTDVGDVRGSGAHASSGEHATGLGVAAGLAPLSSQPLQSAAGYGLPTNQSQQQQVRALPVIKVTQKFARNRDKPADTDVFKQTFYLATGKTIVHFHHADERLTAGLLVFHKDGPAQAVQVRHMRGGWAEDGTSCKIS